MFVLLNFGDAVINDSLLVNYQAKAYLKPVTSPLTTPITKAYPDSKINNRKYLEYSFSNKLHL